MQEKLTADELTLKAWRMRLDMIESLNAAGSGHPGGSLSIAEILSVLYFSEMNIDPQNPTMENRDRFVLSKGHAAPALYAALANKGYFSRDELMTLRKMDSNLQGHPDRKKTVGVDMSTGSLGQGISAACGMAYFSKDRAKAFRVYCIIGDGEMQEGEVWEALMSAGNYKLDNLTVFLDNNNLQIDGSVDKVMSVYPIKEKLDAFNWHTIEIDGNNVSDILKALDEAKKCTDKPTIIISKTVKGKGVSFMENQAGWHGAPMNGEQYKTAVKELTQMINKLQEQCAGGVRTNAVN